MLRCLLFTGDEEVVRAIRQAAAELGMEAEVCADAAETQNQVKDGDFKILIADWNRPEESAGLFDGLKDRTGRERPLVLAVVSDVTGMKAALKAGANSTLRRPLDAAQVRDTLDMARDLLRAKESSKAAAAAAGVGSVSAVGDGDRQLRGAEFLSNARTAPGAQFQVEGETQIPPGQAEAPEEMKPLIELEPMAAEVGVAEVMAETLARNSQAQPPQEPVVAKAEKPMSLEELLRARRQTPPVVESSKVGEELLGYGERHEQTTGTKDLGAGGQDTPAQRAQEQASQAALVGYLEGSEQTDDASGGGTEPPRRMRLGILAAGLAMVVAMTAVKVPVRQWGPGLAMLYGGAVRAGHDWLNPPAVKPVETPVAHDNFARAGDEYKLPTVDPIPDATTDPSEIRVVAVVDPTVKTNSGSAPANPGATGAATGNTDAGKDPVPEATKLPAQESEPAPKGVETLAVSPERSAAAVATLAGQGIPNTAQVARSGQGIPSSLRSQIAAVGPAPGGVKPVEAALTAIEPVELPEAAARALLLQQVAPAYPQTVAANAQRGNVVLAVTVDRDGSVQDAKFMQGSFSFARPAIQAVRQWSFRPYVLNGHAVAVQTVITLSFSPPS
jgi:protein TonB